MFNENGHKTTGTNKTCAMHNSYGAVSFHREDLRDSAAATAILRMKLSSSMCLWSHQHPYPSDAERNKKSTAVLTASIGMLAGTTGSTIL